MARSTFTHRSVIPTTMDRMIAFHSDKAALARLTPPPIFVQLHRDTRTSMSEGELEFTLWFGPIPARWTARHEAGGTEHSFADRMMKGPMKFWRHEHQFREVPGGIELTDTIEYEHVSSGFWAVFTRLFFSGLPLRALFVYRHLRTRWGTRLPSGQTAGA
jgi:ligand-binding SRPBCC domain-containing protein